MSDKTHKKSETQQVCPTVSNPITEEVRSLIEVFACETIRFCGFSKSDIDDLSQFYSLAVVDAFPRYDSDKGNYLAFVRGILFRAKNNIYRTRIRKGTDCCNVAIDNLPEESPFFIDEYTLPPDLQLERKERVEQINKTFEGLDPLLVQQIQKTARSFRENNLILFGASSTGGKHNCFEKDYFYLGINSKTINSHSKGKKEMSWGTYYQYNGYLSHIGKNEIESKREECQSVNDMLWREILAYMAMTPPAYAKDDEGNEYPWAEFIAMKLREFREEIEENNMLVARLDDCDEALRENPENVTEG